MLNGIDGSKHTNKMDSLVKHTLKSNYAEKTNHWASVQASLCSSTEVEKIFTNFMFHCVIFRSMDSIVRERVECLFCQIVTLNLQDRTTYLLLFAAMRIRTSIFSWNVANKFSSWLFHYCWSRYNWRAKRVPTLCILLSNLTEGKLWPSSMSLQNDDISIFFDSKESMIWLRWWSK